MKNEIKDWKWEWMERITYEWRKWIVYEWWIELRMKNWKTNTLNEWVKVCINETCLINEHLKKVRKYSESNTYMNEMFIMWMRYRNACIDWNWMCIMNSHHVLHMLMLCTSRICVYVWTDSPTSGLLLTLPQLLFLVCKDWSESFI